MLTREAWDKLTPDEQWEAYCAAQPAQSLGSARGVSFNGVWYEANTEPSKEVDVPSLNWFNPVDDQGNPPPPGLYGDMFPEWYDGRWWVCWDDLQRRRREKGDQA